MFNKMLTLSYLLAFNKPLNSDP